MLIFIMLLASFVLHLAFAARAILRPAREPISKLVWIMIMFVFPFIGIVAYLLVGEVDLGPIRMAKIREVETALPKPPPLKSARKLPPSFEAAFRTASAVNALPMTSVTSAHLQENTNAAITAMIADIAQAKETVHVAFYIWLTDTNGTRIAQALIDAATRGVSVRAMADAMGSKDLIRSPLWIEMGKLGVKLKVMLPTRGDFLPLLTPRIDLRNHRKLAIIDCAITYIGSQNMADPEFLPKKQFGPWYDVLVRLSGPVALHQQYLFATDWMIEGGDDLSALFIEKSAPQAAGSAAQVFGTGPSLPVGSMSDNFSAALLAAQETVYITTPYFAPDSCLLQAIVATARRGVAVTIVVPMRNDEFFLGLIVRSYYEEMLGAGINIFEFPLGLLHAKTLVVDEKLTLFGSANMDRRSLELNYENNIVVYDVVLSKALRARQNEYISASKPINLADVQNYSLLKKLFYNVCATLSPIL
ncbi:MAG: cardiolipin synthase [Pseudomonadota bacterium]|nr:cardiolipin synthase [Pseudomonadota bacterium]